MIIKNSSKCDIGALFLMTIVLFSQTLFAGVEDTTLNLMREKDRVSQAVGYKISFVMATKDNQFKDPNQGEIFMNCESTWMGENIFAMKVIYEYEHNPIYAPRGICNYTGYDYDNKGNLIVWRTLEKDIISTPDRNETLEKIRVFFIDPNNKIVETGDNIQVHRFKIGDTNNKYQYNQFELATGRGFSKHLGVDASITLLPPRLTEITSRGSWYGSSQGNWKLTVDPVSDNLVRGAIFTMNTATRPSIEVTTSGVIEKDGIKMAKFGNVTRSSASTLNIEITGISDATGGNELYKEVSSCLNQPLPKGAGIIDLTGTKPVRSTVK